MSNEVQGLVWRSAFPSPTAKLVAVKLADNSNDDGQNVYPSLTTVERQTGLSRSAVCEQLAMFDRVGLVKRTGRVSTLKTSVRQFDMTMLSALADTRRRDGTGTAPRLEWRRNESLEWCLAAIASPPGALVRQTDQSARRTMVVRSADSGSPPGAPKPSRNHPLTPTHKRGGLVDVWIEEMIRAAPDCAMIVNELLAPIVRAVAFSAPEPLPALIDLAKSLSGLDLPSATVAEARERVIASRGTKVYVKNILDAVSIANRAKALADHRQHEARPVASTAVVGTLKASPEFEISPDDLSWGAWMRALHEQDPRRARIALQQNRMLVSARWPVTPGAMVFDPGAAP